MIKLLDLNRNVLVGALALLAGAMAWCRPSQPSIDDGAAVAQW